MEKYDNDNDTSETFEVKVSTKENIKHRSVPTRKKTITETILFRKFGDKKTYTIK